MARVFRKQHQMSCIFWHASLSKAPKRRKWKNGGKSPASNFRDVRLHLHMSATALFSKKHGMDCLIYLSKEWAICFPVSLNAVFISSVDHSYFSISTMHASSGLWLLPSLWSDAHGKAPVISGSNSSLSLCIRFQDTFSGKFSDNPFYMQLNCFEVVRCHVADKHWLVMQISESILIRPISTWPVLWKRNYINILNR